MHKIIISDTSCLIALSKIKKLDLLNKLYDDVFVTNDVYQEFGALLPKWIIVADVKNKKKQKQIENYLDKGEASSITLALEYKTATLIIDEKKGRKIAQSLNIKITGTIGLIILGFNKGVIPDVTSLILKLVNKGFRLSDDLMNKIIEKYSH